MQGIPPAKDTDAEDVVWGLQTAEALWKRGERIDAIVWLRRAAQAAGEATDDDRALELARAAAELSDWMATLPPGASQAPPPQPNTARTYAPHGSATQVPDGGPVSIDIDIDDAEGARGQLPVFPSASLRIPRPMPPLSRPPSQPTMETAEPVFPEEPQRDRRDAARQTPMMPLAPPLPQEQEPEERQPRTTSVPPADKVHAGMYNPWDDRASPPPIAPPPPLAPRFPPEQEEVVTSVRPQQLAQQRADALASMLAGGTSQSDAPAPRAPVAWAEEEQEALKPPPARPARPAPPRPPPLPPGAMKPRAPTAPRVASEPPMRVTPPPPSPTQVMTHPRPAEASSLTEQVQDNLPEAQTAAPETPTSPPEPATAPPQAQTSAHGSKPPPGDRLDLDNVEAFADLPDDARLAFASAATVSALAEGEEVSAFALAYILSGSVDVAATMVDAPAARLTSGAVLRSRGTTDDGVPMRLIGVSSGVVATWTDAAVQDAFRTCPWVEEDLRVSADRLQTLVGVTIGPLGERLDAAIREQIIGRLTMRTLRAGDVVVTAGEQMPGLLLVGVGELELIDGDQVAGVVGSGEFLFPTEVLGGGDAPRTARAGPGGARILFGDRLIAQELLVTCPPLLEVFAGM